MDQQPSEARSVNKRTAQLIHTILHRLWDDFYAWKRAHALETLSALCPATETGPTQRSRHMRSIAILARSEDQEVQSDDDDSLNAEIVEVPLFEPSPTYEDCAQTHHNITVEDDPDIMPFLPFADDEDFDHADHMEWYKYLGWQDPYMNRGPDDDLIVLETIRELRGAHGVFYAEIQQTLNLPSGRELARRFMKRDFPAWPIHLQGLEKGPSITELFDASPVPLTTDLALRVAHQTWDFCPNLNCVLPFCRTHSSVPSGDFILPPIAATMTGVALKQSTQRPCGSRCFAQLPLGSPVASFRAMGAEGSASRDSEEEEPVLDELRDLLAFMPDATPCDLAEIVLLPCDEVFRLRQQLLPDVVILRATVDDYERQAEATALVEGQGHVNHASARAPVFKDPKIEKYTPPENTCNHPGPCEGSAECLCFLSGGYCERNCRCSLSCVRRFRGCTCHKGTKGKGNLACAVKGRCPCMRAGRECDPEVCRRCQAGDRDAGGCRNAQIQQGRSKATSIRRGDFGIGLFLEERAADKDLIMEYVGEIILDGTMKCRQDLAEYRGRNYVFGINHEWSIDSTKAGNATRFINHAPKEKANCKATVKMVNGDYRIGIYAKKSIKKGTEMVFDYGKQFFETQGNDEGSEEL